MNRPALVLVSVALAMMIARAEAGPSCAAACVHRMAECHATNCAQLSRRSCRDRCRAITGCSAGGARIETLLSLVFECRSGEAMGGWTIRQRLEVRRGDCPPVIVKKAETPVPAPDPDGLCRFFGERREALFSWLVGVFQRLEVTPDGRWIVFELTDEQVHERFGSPRFSLQEKGIFRVAADGTGTRALGPASRQPRCVEIGDGPPGAVEGFVCDAGFESSPNGKLMVFTDRGPGADGSDAAQLMTLDVRTGERRQVTRFVAASQIVAPSGFFADDDTIQGYTFDRTGGLIFFTVGKDGFGFREMDLPTIGSGSRLVPIFDITSRPGGARVFTASFPGGANEIVVQDRRGMMVQVTKFGRPDTAPIALAPAGKRIFFRGSGGNPEGACQLFSVGALGGNPRQLTPFVPDLIAPGGCLARPPPPACVIGPTFLDKRLSTLVFSSSCDRFGTNPRGQQTFAVRTDGSGLRQITNYRGMREESDGAISVELGAGTTGPP